MQAQVQMIQFPVMRFLIPRGQGDVVACQITSEIEPNQQGAHLNGNLKIRPPLRV